MNEWILQSIENLRQERMQDRISKIKYSLHYLGDSFGTPDFIPFVNDLEECKEQIDLLLKYAIKERTFRDEALERKRKVNKGTEQ